jgi:hypothetical protein
MILSMYILAPNHIIEEQYSITLDEELNISLLIQEFF